MYSYCSQPYLLLTLLSFFAASNLLLDYTAQRLKLTDFGFAQILDQYTSEIPADENAGTLSYNPPEASITYQQ